ncbi:Phospholipase D beta 1, partial [Orobanche minor]
MSRLFLFLLSLICNLDACRGKKDIYIQSRFLLQKKWTTKTITLHLHTLTISLTPTLTIHHHLRFNIHRLQIQAHNLFTHIPTHPSKLTINPLSPLSGHLNYPYPTSSPSPVPNHPPNYTPYPYQYPVYPSPPQPAPPPQPNLQTYGSFQYGSFHYLNHQPSGRLQPPPDAQSEANNIVYLNHQSSGRLQPPNDAQSEVPPRVSTDYSNHHHNPHAPSVCDSTSNSDRMDDSSPHYPSVYPPIDEHLTSMRLSDSHSQNKPSKPSSPQKYHSGPLPITNNNHNVPGTIYGHRTNSFSSWEANSMGNVESFRPNTGPQVTTAANMQLVQVSSPRTSLKVLLLHGNLDIWVYEAKNLPNMDMFHKTLGDMFNKLPGNMSSKIEGQINRKITSDPYVSIAITGATLGRTYVISNDENPIWTQNFIVPVAHNAAEVNFVVKDNDVVGSQHIGTVSIPVEQIYGGERIQGIFPILNVSGKPCKAGAVLSLGIQYHPIEKLSVYDNGIGSGPDYAGVPGTYFPLRRGGTVSLYQDAHVPDNSLPNLKLDNGMHYIHGKCWRDIFDAIRHARRLIYITGWSVWHKVRLVRDDNSMSDYTLGELLKSKSQEGVRVLLLVWDDPTSRSILGYKTDGVMQTHDEETRRFFKHSSVQVLLCPRVAGKRHSWVKQREVGVIYTHHQKTVVVDADAGNNRRRIIAFLGGLDLCDGRYDTPQHPIFRTLQTLHSDDYHNPTYVFREQGNVAGCPREPWHDLHCKIDGPAAYDVLSNFEERWLKASKPHGIKKLKISYDDALLRIERMPEILGLSDAPCVSEDDPEGW